MPIDSKVAEEFARVTGVTIEQAYYDIGRLRDAGWVVSKIERRERMPFQFDESDLT